MNGANNYPSCIKIPATNSKQSTVAATLPQKFELKEALAINDQLISLANEVLGKKTWNHTITSQTLDFVESLQDAYHCGCVTFVKMELLNGSSHEDMGYCFAEERTKGLAIHTARVGSMTDAFRKVLICFGKELEIQVENLMKKHQSAVAHNNVTEDIQCFLSNVPVDILEPCARSTPYITRKPCEPMNIPDTPCTSKSGTNHKGQTDAQQATWFKKPNDQEGQLTAQPSISKAKSPIGETGYHIQQADDLKILPKSLSDLRGQVVLQHSVAKQQKDHDSVTVQKEQEQKRGSLSEEEKLRMERKRRQMEKQAEYKRMMKERELQKSNEIKKPNPKY